MQDVMPPSSSGSRTLGDGLAVCQSSPVSQGEGQAKIIPFHRSVVRGRSVYKPSVPF